MIEPGPSRDELCTIVKMAARTPDHGKLAPWRFVIIADRDMFAAILQKAYRIERPVAGRLETEAVEQFARQAPTLVAVLSAPVIGSKIPLWEQQLSAGAVCMNLLHAAHAKGFVGSWITGWAAYSEIVRDALGKPGQSIAGFVFIGSAGRPLEERPRPELHDILTCWGDSSTG